MCWFVNYQKKFLLVVLVSLHCVCLSPIEGGLRVVEVVRTVGHQHSLLEPDMCLFWEEIQVHNWNDNSRELRLDGLGLVQQHFSIALLYKCSNNTKFQEQHVSKQFSHYH